MGIQHDSNLNLLRFEGIVYHLRAHFNRVESVELALIQ
jgi:hypothetical protein